MNRISRFISAYLKGRQERKAEQRKAVMQSESLKVVQVMEFQKQLYICYVENVQTVLNDARTIREKYIESNNIKFGAQ